MRLIITRHGETEENKLGIMQGRLPGKLSTLGIEQARKTAERLKGEKIDFIYSSDLTRASDTAKEIAKFHPHTPIEFVEELRERDIGEYTGKKKSDFGWEIKDMKVTTLDTKNGETVEQYYNRAKSFLHRTFLNHLNSTILLVGHNGINKALVAVILGKDYENVKNMENQHNTSISIFEVDENKNHKIHLLNDIKHLE